MASQTSSTLTRYRPAILVLAALATGCTIYYVHNSTRTNNQTDDPSRRLRRSNAVHRQRPRRNRPNGAPATPSHPNEDPDSEMRFYSALELLHVYQNSPADFGTFTTSIGELEYRTPLVRGSFPSLDHLKEEYSCSQEEAERVRKEFEEKLLQAFLHERLPRQSVIPGADEMFPLLQGEGFMFRAPMSTVLPLWNVEALSDPPERRVAPEVQMVFQTPRRRSRRLPQIGDAALNQALDAMDVESPDVINVDEGAAIGDVPDTTIDGESEHSWRGGDENEDESRREGQNLLNMLYHIAEDRSRREGYVHRGVSCNSCNAHPIRGIRYRCANCVDYDLCEQCEAMQLHPKTHLFYKIRIPAPYLGNPRRPQPVWYPGKPAGLPIHLNREVSMSLSKESGFDTSEIDALWDQFKCLAAVEWPGNPNPFGMAIDRDTFDKCFIPTTSSIRSPATLLIYDRMFSFYDANHDGLIGFQEFVVGLSAMRSKNKEVRTMRIFHGYDHNADGYIDRKDCLLMFRAFYTLTQELTRDMVAGMEEDLLEGGNLRENVGGTQPISSVYTGSIPSAERPQVGEGKRQDEFGDMVISDGRGMILDNKLEEGDQQEVIGDLSEIAAFGSLDDPTRTGRPAKAIPDNNSDRSLGLTSSSSGSQTESAFSGVAFGPEVGQWEALPDDSAIGIPRERSTTPPAGISDLGRSPSGSQLEGVFPFGPEVGQWELLPDDSAIGIPGEPTPTTPPARISDCWPPTYVLPVDVDSALRESVPLREVSSPSDRYRVLQAAERRLDIEQRRWEARQAGLHRRVDRRQFYLDEEQERSSPNLSYSPGDPDKQEAAVSNSHAVSPKPDKRVNNEDSTCIKASTNAGSRTAPPLDEDVGREVLYQITQEGLNELLDPLFKCREDLAIEVMRTKARRTQLREDLAPFQSEGMKKVCRLQAERFQRQYRVDSTTPSGDFGEKLRGYVENQEDIKEMAYAEYLWDMRKVGVLEDEDFGKKMAEILKARHKNPDQAMLREMEKKSKRGGKSNRGSVLSEASTTSESSAKPEGAPAPSEDLTSAAEGAQPEVEYPPAAIELHEAVRAFDEANPNVEETIMETGLGDLLESAGYAVAEEVGKGDESQAVEIPASGEVRDPTLPQNRPSTVSDSRASTFNDHASHSSENGKEVERQRGSSSRLLNGESTDASAPTRQELKYLALLNIIEEEDNGERGGPGRLSFAEFEEILKGQQGSKLGFLGSWIELVNF